MRTYAEQLGDFTANLEFHDIPGSLIESIKLHLLDTIGVCLACSTMPYAQILTDIIGEEGGKPESTVISFGDKLSARGAAFINGSLAHGADFDDSHLEAVLHPTGAIMPAVFALGEKQRIDGEIALAAITAGLEIMTRLGVAGSPGLIGRWIHPTSACGIFGAAAGAGKILALSPDQIATALGICGSMASGSMEWLADGSWTKCMHPGWAAQAGILAAQMAKKGYTGPHTILEGKRGFYNVFVGQGCYDLEKVSRALGQVWESAKIAFKLYPCCHGTHAYIDCALWLKKKYKIDPDQIAEIECKVGEKVGISLCEPREIKIIPPTPYGAKFSIPYTISVALIEGKVGLPEFSDEKIRDPGILNLARKVNHTMDVTYDEGMALRGWLQVKMKDGKEYLKEVNSCKGTPENPCKEEEIMEKFMSNATMVTSETKAMRLAEILKRLDQLSDISELMNYVKSETYKS